MTIIMMLRPYLIFISYFNLSNQMSLIAVKIKTLVIFNFSLHAVNLIIR
jgi:hypothetical protein